MTPDQILIPHESTGSQIAIFFTCATSFVTLLFGLWKNQRDSDTRNRIKIIEAEQRTAKEELKVAGDHAANASQYGMQAQKAAQAAVAAVNVSKVDRKEQLQTISAKLDETKAAVETATAEVKQTKELSIAAFHAGNDNQTNIKLIGASILKSVVEDNAARKQDRQEEREQRQEERAAREAEATNQNKPDANNQSKA